MPSAHPRRESQRLPVMAAGPVSRILGGVEPGYRVARTDRGLVARNPGQRLVARFTPAGVTVNSGRLSVRVQLRGYGYGHRLAMVRPTAPLAAGNRVEYRLGRLTQWFANGPMGLEQGFSVSAPPASLRTTAGRLTLALGVSGSSRLALAGGGVVFRRAASALAYRDLVVSDALGRRLPASLSLARGEVLVHADVRGARYPVTVDPVFRQLAKLTASDGANSNYLGWSVAISGDTVVAGASGANGGQGAAYVFTKPASGWANETQAAKLTASDGAAGANLGYSVAIDGSTVVAGAPNATVSSHSDQGAAYVFTEPGTGWSSETQAAKLTASDGAAGANLGYSVAAGPTTVVAGAPNATVSSHSDQGAAYVFTRPGAAWSSETEAAKLTASDGSTNDGLGWSVAVAGNVAVAGAPNATVGSNGSQGAAYVFGAPVAGWSSVTQAAKLTATDGTGGDKLGFSVAINALGIVAGAPYASVGSNSSQGAAYLFTEPAGGWFSETQAGALTAADGAANDNLGYSVAAGPNSAVGGAPNATVGSNGSQGAAYVFGVAASPRPRLAALSLGRFFSPRRWSRWKPGSVVTVAVAVDYAGGPPIPGSLAAVLAADCDVTVRAWGAQTLATHCMRYDRATQIFVYRWRLGTHRAGRVTLVVQLSYPSSTTSVLEQITISR